MKKETFANVVKIIGAAAIISSVSAIIIAAIFAIINGVLGSASAAATFVGIKLTVVCAIAALAICLEIVILAILKVMQIIRNVYDRFH